MLAILLRITSAAEAITGLTLIALPHLVSNLLFGAPLTGAGIAAARVAGIGILSLGIACWPARNGQQIIHSSVAMLIYNLLVTAYLFRIGLTGSGGGIALWPVIALHLSVVILFLIAVVRSRAQGANRIPHQ